MWYNVTGKYNREAGQTKSEQKKTEELINAVYRGGNIAQCFVYVCSPVTVDWWMVLRHDLSHTRTHKHAHTHTNKHTHTHTNTHTHTQMF